MNSLEMQNFGLKIMRIRINGVF